MGLNQVMVKSFFEVCSLDLFMSPYGRLYDLNIHIHLLAHSL